MGSVRTRASDHRHLFVLSARGDDQLGGQRPRTPPSNLGHSPPPHALCVSWAGGRLRGNGSGLQLGSARLGHLRSWWTPQEHVGRGAEGLAGIGARPARRQGSMWPRGCPGRAPATLSREARRPEPGECTCVHASHTHTSPVGGASMPLQSLAVAGGGGGLSEAPGGNPRRRGHNLCPGGCGEQGSSEPVPLPLPLSLQGPWGVVGPRPLPVHVATSVALVAAALPLLPPGLLVPQGDVPGAVGRVTQPAGAPGPALHG